MNSKKVAAKKASLEKLSKSLKDEMYSSLGDELKAKKDAKLSKVTVMAKDEEGLVKGLSKAKQLLKAKFGQDVEEEEEDGEESEDSEEEECPECEGKGCDACEEEAEEE